MDPFGVFSACQDKVRPLIRFGIYLYCFIQADRFINFKTHGGDILITQIFQN